MRRYSTSIPSGPGAFFVFNSDRASCNSLVKVILLSEIWSKVHLGEELISFSQLSRFLECSNHLCSMLSAGSDIFFPHIVGTFVMYKNNNVPAII